MPKRPTHYYRPGTLEEALRLLAQPDTVPLGGGTKLLAGDVDGAVVDLQDLGLNRLEWADGSLVAGATVISADLASNLAENKSEAGPGALLQKALRQAGPNTYRHAATLGGMIASRLPDSELLAALLVLAPTLHLAGAELASMPLTDYLEVAQRPSGLMTAVSIPWLPGQGDSVRVARTPADDPIVSVTMWQPTDGAPRFAATGLGERPFRLLKVEDILADGRDEAAVRAAAAAAKAACHHPGDFRGGAAYRAEMAAVLTRRLLTTN